MNVSTILDYLNIFSLIFFSWRNVYIVKILLLIITILNIYIHVIIILKEKKKVVSYFKYNILCIIIPLFMMLSSFYSSNINDTISKSLYLLLMTIYILTICINYNKSGFYKVLCKYFIITILISLIVCIIKPSIGMMYYKGNLVAKGIFTHKNILARNLILGITVLFNTSLYCKNRRSKLFLNTVTMIALLLIIMSRSSTGVILSSLAIILSILFRKRCINYKIYKKIMYFTLIILNLITYIISRPYISQYLSNIKIGSKNLGFTGRTDIWNFSIQAIQNRPILGYGFDNFWNNEYNRETFNHLYGYTANHSHNGYLNVLLDGGILLIILLLLLIFKSIKYSNKAISNEYEKISIIFLTLLLIINQMESAFIDDTTYLFWIVICFIYCKRKENN